MAKRNQPLRPGKSRRTRAREAAPPSEKSAAELIAELFPLDFAAIHSEIAELDDEPVSVAPTVPVPPSKEEIAAELASHLDARMEQIERNLAAAIQRHEPPPPLPAPTTEELVASVREMIQPELTAKLMQLQDAVTKVTERVNAGLAIKTPLTEEALVTWFQVKCRVVIDQAKGEKTLPPLAFDNAKLFERLLKLGWSDGVLTGVSNRVVLSACATSVAAAFLDASKAATTVTVNTATHGGESTYLPVQTPLANDPDPLVHAESGVGPPRKKHPITIAHVLKYPLPTQQLLERLPWKNENCRYALSFWLQHRLLGQTVEELADHHGEEKGEMVEHFQLIEKQIHEPVPMP